ncbi:SDR family NAD(P)-dependent oxidoreductase [Yinghuangia aomiensis]
MGLAITRTLTAEGARVVAASRTSTPALDALAGPNLRHLAADLMDPDAPARIVAHAVETFGGLDILVNNAGGPPPGVELPRGSFPARVRLGLACDVRVQPVLRRAGRTRRDSAPSGKRRRLDRQHLFG